MLDLRRKGKEELEISVKTKERASEKERKSECKFRLIIRRGVTKQVASSTTCDMTKQVVL